MLILCIFSMYIPEIWFKYMSMLKNPKTVSDAFSSCLVISVNGIF